MVHIWVTAHIWARVCQVSTYLDEQTRLRETAAGRAHSHAGVHIWMRDRGSSLAGGAHLADGIAGDEHALASTHIWVSVHLGEVRPRGNSTPAHPHRRGQPARRGCRNGAPAPCASGERSAAAFPRPRRASPRPGRAHGGGTPRPPGRAALGEAPGSAAAAQGAESPHGLAPAPLPAARCHPTCAARRGGDALGRDPAEPARASASASPAPSPAGAYLALDLDDGLGGARRRAVVLGHGAGRAGPRGRAATAAPAATGDFHRP